MAIVVRDEGRRINSNINVTPMVDVMLVLLIIFMVITPMLTPGPQVQLAKTRNPVSMPDANKDDAILVAVNRDGQVFLGNEQIVPSELVDRIRERIASRDDRRVFVKADARSHYRAVAEVVDDVRSAGVGEVALLTERRAK
jgi:biopolymer transport protein ExbD/biopolymer transport protein TolR